MADSRPILQEIIARHKTIPRMDPSQKEYHGLSLAEELEHSRGLLRKLEEEGERLERITYYEAYLRGKKKDEA
ncbi:hypothetical protein F4813DRAFT_394351 [Daldinia decipiens]|uniref:uncharacterized protein n=1 Tax=Daldinia decipiens TaxID=326647 RepID=UPI0020C2467E|nr:uncharacterized protein F4813DRAFT_394351 [Daldinia decipiens]KAI1652803.1 hypothetical protein F4813DRAFT_394351 [Daldinia decipiens]